MTAPIGLGRIHLVPILAEFLSTYPDIIVRLVLGDRILSLPEEYVDVALPIGVLPDSGLMALRLGTILFIVCARPPYLALRGSPATPGELAAHDCIIHDSFHVWTFASGQTDIAMTVRPRLVLSNAGAACDGGAG